MSETTTPDISTHQRPADRTDHGTGHRSDHGTAGSDDAPNAAFPSINRAFARVFEPDRLTVGLVVPIEQYPTPVPTMERHVERVRLAESLGFAAVWLRDVPFDVQTFGDAGLTFDPFVYLGLLAGATDQIGLGVASVILPLRHPAHVAKAAASADVLSGGRLLLGVASGDRPDEFPAMGVPHAERGARFRAAFEYVERMAETAPGFDNPYGSPTSGMNMLPKPVGGRIPLLVTGGSQQPPEWLASHGDAWMTYPRPTLGMQSAVVADFRARVAAVGRGPRPVMQPLYVDLADDPTAAPTPIHLGLRLGVDRLVEHLTGLRSIGINHVAINLRFNTSPTEQAMRRLAERVLPALDP